MNLPLIGIVNVVPVPSGAPAAALLAADDPDEMQPVVDLLTQTRKSLTLRSLFMTGFPHDPEFFAAGVALARQWSRQGLKVAVVDLDFRHPTVLRPRPAGNEGYVDALEYGCSFQRIAWELVADALWVVGPGSHPPDEQRFAEHPDWARVMRIFSARVDVTLYLAPFLDRKGFTGSLSKRMDGVLLAVSVRRAGRAALRDAFLELWGSDAPMIGCLGIGLPSDYHPPDEVELGPVSPAIPPPPEQAAPARRFEASAQAPRLEPSAPAPWLEPSAHARTPAQSASGAAAAPPRRLPAMRRIRQSGDAAPQALVARLSEEVRRGQVPRSARPRPRGLLLAALLLVVLAGAGAFVTYQALRRQAPHAAETLPAGTEQVLPADIGAASPDGLPGAGVPDAGAPTQSGASDGSANSAAGAGEDGAALAPEPPAEPPPAERAASASQNLSYRVHVASFRSESNVKDLVKRLRARGLDAWYAKATDQPNWFRVFVGHYATHEEASRKAAWLLEHGWVEHAMAYPDKER